jgi:hypothetical protein
MGFCVERLHRHPAEVPLTMGQFLEVVAWCRLADEEAKKAHDRATD